MGSATKAPSDSEGSDTSTSSTGVLCECKDFVPAVSNFSIQYNYACASIATAVMLSHNDQTGKKVRPDFAEPQWAKDTLLSIVFVGSVFGMLSMGYLGDLLGIQKALIITNALTVLGALASALLSVGGADSVWSVIAVSRFVLGAGVGGNYPLSAAKASETTHSLKEAVNKAADAFFWQGPGSCTPYLLGLLLLQLPSSPWRTAVQFRTLLAAGAFPSMVVWLASMKEPSHAPAKKNAGGLSRALAKPEHWWTLLGTAGTWFFFDVAFYGMVIFAPTILEDVFGKGESLGDLAWHAAFMSFLGILGTLAGVRAVHRIDPKLLNTSGLSLGAILFAAFLLVHEKLPDCSNVLFVLLCLLYFVLYFSANIATFVLPVVSFPKDVRSTFHGLSAAAAKVGAMTGALLFPVVDRHYGTAAVMAIQALVCAAGALLCHLCVESESNEGCPTDESDDLEESGMELKGEYGPQEQVDESKSGI